jgi:hypothetical protein
MAGRMIVSLSASPTSDPLTGEKRQFELVLKGRGFSRAVNEARCVRLSRRVWRTDPLPKNAT